MGILRLGLKRAQHRAATPSHPVLFSAETREGVSTVALADSVK